MTKEALEPVEVEAEIIEEEVVDEGDTIAHVSMDIFNQLTKRNQQFMLALDKNLSAANLTAETKKAVYTEMCETLITGQHTGQTARHLYGTPTECAEVILKQQFPSEDDLEKSEDWKIGLDGGLMLGSIYALLTGFVMMRNAGAAESGQAFVGMGILTIIISYIVAGFAMLITSKVMPDMDAPKGQRGYVRYFAVTILAMTLWAAAILLSSAFLPVSINPILSYEMYFIIGAITMAARFYLKRKLSIRGGLF